MMFVDKMYHGCYDHMMFVDEMEFSMLLVATHMIFLFLLASHMDVGLVLSDLYACWSFSINHLDL